MPNLTLALPEIEQSISKPAIIGVVKDLQKIMGLPEAQVYYDRGRALSTSGGTIDSKENGYVKTKGRRKNVIQATELPDPTDALAFGTSLHEYPPIFNDYHTQTAIFPYYVRHSCQLNYEYYFNSETESNRWFSDMLVNANLHRDIILHSLNYHFGIHQQAMDILKEVHKRREAIAKYNETFEEYFKKYSIRSLTTISGVNGLDPIYAIPQTQVEVYGQFDFDIFPDKPEVIEDTGQWVCKFGYLFKYDKPISMKIKFPIMVHNQPMPYELVNMDKLDYNVFKNPVSSSKTSYAANTLRTDRRIDDVRSHYGRVKIPMFDDVVLKNERKGTTQMLTALCQINEKNKKDLASLKDLGDIVLDDEVIAFMEESEYPYMLIPYGSILQIEVFKSEYVCNYSDLSINNQLMISSLVDLDLRRDYRIRFSVVSDIDLLSQSAINRVRNYPSVLNKILKANNRIIRQEGLFDYLDESGYLSLNDFDYIRRVVSGKEKNLIPPTSVGLDPTLPIPSQTLRDLRIDQHIEKTVLVIGTIANVK